MNNGEDWTESTYALAEEAIGYAFSDKALLLRCFTHSTYAGREASNERLEFLGDAVLQLIVTEMLYRTSGADEGKLTETRKQYVSQRALETAESRVRLMRFLRHAGGESNVGGKTRSSLFEAVLGGIYLDGGMGEAERFVSRFLSEIETDNYKTLLQEYVQERQRATPHYATSETEAGYRCTVTALGASAEGEGGSKKEAETQAAKRLYRYFSEKRTHS